MLTRLHTQQEVAMIVSREYATMLMEGIKILLPYLTGNLLLQELVHIGKQEYVEGQEQQCIDIAKGLNISKTFLITKLQSYLPNAPTIDITLLEKQLSIFMSQNVSSNHSSSKITMVNILNSICDNYESMEWKELATFTILVGIWLIQQAYIASSLLLEFGMEYSELSELSKLFSMYTDSLLFKSRYFFCLFNYLLLQ
jgi:hypothetical protein